jgi:hypothetical protein
MSFGFIRKQSPASIADARRRARLLTNLKINEVSSVDRGAGEGVRVQLMKRDSSGDEVRKWDGVGELAGPGGRGYRYVKEEKEMTLSDRIEKSHSAAIQGHITWAEAAQEQTDRALQAFPTARSAGEAMTKYMATEVGKRDVNNLHKLQHIKQQWDTRLGDAVAPGNILKAEAEPHTQRDRGGDGVDDGDESGVEEPWDKRVKNLMDKLGCSQDEAISHLHRAEKVSKGM